MKECDPRHLLMLGPPASGKGTQGRRLAKALDADYLSTGAELRREIEKGSALGIEANKYLSRNDYVPDELAMALVNAWLSERDGAWVLDGFPRRLSQAEFICQQEALSQQLQAIHLCVPVDVLRSRVAQRRECVECQSSAKPGDIQCGLCGGALAQRRDDSEEGFESRLQWYERETTPVLDYLRARDMLVEIDGLGSVEEVWLRLQKELC